MSAAREQSEQCGVSEWVSGASERANEQASGPVLTSRFLALLNHPAISLDSEPRFVFPLSPLSTSGDSEVTVPFPWSQFLLQWRIFTPNLTRGLSFYLLFVQKAKVTYGSENYSTSFGYSRTHTQFYFPAAIPSLFCNHWMRQIKNKGWTITHDMFENERERRKLFITFWSSNTL